MSNKINHAALIERHMAGARWESIRAAYFMRTGKPKNAAQAESLIRYHRDAADEVCKKAQSDSWNS